jgi:hypothetical protein
MVQPMLLFLWDYLAGEASRKETVNREITVIPMFKCFILYVQLCLLSFDKLRMTQAQGTIDTIRCSLISKPESFDIQSRILWNPSPCLETTICNMNYVSVISSKTQWSRDISLGQTTPRLKPHPSAGGEF